MKFLAIDGNSILNRAFYGIKLLTTKDGQYTNGIYGFLNILIKLEQDIKPDCVLVAFDLKAKTFRHKMFDGYKAGRKGMPDELAQQMPVLKEILADLGYNIVTKEGFEADDILGTIAKIVDTANIYLLAFENGVGKLVDYGLCHFDIVAFALQKRLAFGNDCLHVKGLANYFDIFIVCAKDFD